METAVNTQPPSPPLFSFIIYDIRSYNVYTSFSVSAVDNNYSNSALIKTAAKGALKRK